MVPDVFSLTYDHAQTRPQTPSLFFSFRSTDYNEGLSSNVWQDPVTRTLMMRPMALYDAWYTSNSGIHAKPAKAAYDFSTASNWEEVEWFPGAGKYVRTETSGEFARTATAPGKNRPVVLSFVNFGAGDQSEICTFGWDDTVTTSSSTLYFVLTASGRLDAYKNGDYVQTLNLNIPQTNEGVVLLLMPMRTMELLVFCDNTQSGGLIRFDDITEGTTPGTITPAEKFWFKPNSSANVAQVQIAPVTFESSGYATSSLITFSEAPRTGATLRTTTNPVFTSVTNANVYGVKSGTGTDNIGSIGIYEDDGTTSYTPDDVITQIRVRINFSSDGSYTSFFYAFSSDYSGTTDTTDNADEVSPDSYLIDLSIDVPDGAFDALVEAAYKEPDTLASSILKLRTVRNRPAKLEVGSYVFWDGMTLPTKFSDASIDCAKSAIIPVRDMTRRLDLFMFRDEIPFDGYQLSKPATGSNFSMVEFILLEAGLARSEMNLSDAGYLLEEIPGVESGEWAFSVRAGDSARSFLEQVHDELAADWFMGPRPSASGMQFCFLDPDDLPSTSVLTLYRTSEDAETGGVSSSVSKDYVFMQYQDEPEEIDANVILATGLNPRTQEIVQSSIKDSASIDATTAAGSRPDNWVGMEKPFGVFDPRLRTSTDTDQAVTLLAETVGASRIFGEFTTNTMLWYNSDPGGTDLMLPVWRGDLITLDGVGDVRITSFHVDVLRNAGSAPLTRCRYTFGGFTHAGGSSLGEIQKKNRAKRARSMLDLRRVGMLNPVHRRIGRSFA